MNEKDLLQKIRKDAESVTPPPSLSPEAVERMLRSRNKAGTDSAREQTVAGQTQADRLHTAGENPAAPGQEKPEGRRFRRNRFSRLALRYGSMAAVFVLAVAAFRLADRISQEQDTADPAQIRTASEFDTETINAEAEISAADDNEAADAPERGLTTKSAGAKERLSYASSYREIYDALYALYDYEEGSSAGDLARGITVYEAEMAVEDSLPELGSSASGTADYSNAADSGSTDYSLTNVQEEGVDESDIIKTDGSYLYILRSDASFAIVKAASAKEEAALVSMTEIESGAADCTAEELYLDGDTLLVITSEYVTDLTGGEDVYYTTSGSRTSLYTYDISDRSAPVLTGTVTQDGSYADSRKTGDHIYLFSRWNPVIRDTYEDSSIIPMINGTGAEASDYYLPDSLTDSRCLIISSVDQTSPSVIRDSKVLVSAAEDFYVSQENIYIVNTSYREYSPVTEITKFHYESGEITGTAAGSVPGYLNDTFSMNEYNGNLRIVVTGYGDQTSEDGITTDWTERNALYILDEALQQTGSITDLAKGETIRSARFFGDIGYFVTFRQTDPLFSVDLSDPGNPQVLGELKVSGFSSYLHFYGENRLLGIGYEADEETGVTTGLKLSMFDISDPANVQETDRYVFSGITWCDSLENYKSILADASKNLIGFYCEDRYLVFSYSEEEGFCQEMIYDFFGDQLAGEADSSSMRGLYIGDTFYLAGSSFVIRFDMEDGFAKTQVLEF